MAHPRTESSMPSQATLKTSASRLAAVRAVKPTRTRPFEVFESKLRIPPVRPGMVSRIGLVNRLRSERSRRLTTLVAAAGYGKTTLLAQWAARDTRPFAWVTVDRHDDEPLALLRHIAVALYRIDVVDLPTLTALAEPGPSVWSDAAPRIAAAVAAAPHAFVLVLDNADRLQDADGADLVEALAEHIAE